jgi:hypothetical protein
VAHDAVVAAQTADRDTGDLAHEKKLREDGTSNADRML